MDWFYPEVGETITLCTVEVYRGSRGGEMLVKPFNSSDAQKDPVLLKLLSVNQWLREYICVPGKNLKEWVL